AGLRLPGRPGCDVSFRREPTSVTLDGHPKGRVPGAPLTDPEAARDDGDVMGDRPKLSTSEVERVFAELGIGTQEERDRVLRSGWPLGAALAHPDATSLALRLSSDTADAQLERRAGEPAEGR